MIATITAPTGVRRYRVARLALLAMVVMVAGFAASPAYGGFGDGFGVAPVHSPGYQAPTAMPGAQSVPAGPLGKRFAFWAGACDRALAPAIGVPIGDDLGTRSPTFVGPPGTNVAGAQTVWSSPQLPLHCIDWGSEGPYPASDAALWNNLPAWRLPAAIRAGGHPDGTVVFHSQRNAEDGNAQGTVDGAVDNIVVELPPGFVGDPTAVTKCTADEFAVTPPRCPPQSQVGVLNLRLSGPQGQTSGNLEGSNADLMPVYNLEPRRGNVAELGLVWVSSERATTVRLVAKARTNSDFGVTTFVAQVPSTLALISQQITIWGVPWAAHNDIWRAPQGLQPGPVSFCTESIGGGGDQYIPVDGFSLPGCAQAYDPSWGPIRPFINNLTGPCDGVEPMTTLRMDAYQHPGSFDSEGDPVVSDPNWKSYEAPAEPIVGCDGLPFGPDIDFAPTTAAADGATGLAVDLDHPQNDDPPAEVADDPTDVTGAPAHWRSPAGRATAHLKDTVVTLPDGLSVNPSAAPGLAGCSDVGIGLRQLGNPPLFNNGDPFDKDNGADGAECPDGSKIGTVEVVTPLLEETLTGDLVLGEPKSTDPQSGEMFRLFIVVRNQERGLIAKVYGSTKADPTTGRLTTTFLSNPRIPFESLRLNVEGGSRGLLAMPQRCGDHGWSSTFSPWSGTPSVPDSGGIAASANCGFGFDPGLNAGTSPRGARANTAFEFTFTRREGDQWLRGLTAKLPQGLLASVRDVPLCTNAQAAAGACPEVSRIGSVDAGAGSGDPFFLERKGDVYLTDGYKGGAYGLMVRVPVEAGPFRGSRALSPIVVRQAIHVDPTTAAVTAISDPFPLVHHGIPIRARQVTVQIDRSQFMLNPSDCASKQIGAAIASAQGTVADRAASFQATGCANLPFKPNLKLRLAGRKQVTTGKHPSIRAHVTQAGVGEAGIERAEVRLPKSLALDVNNAQALCEYWDGTKPDLENHCPKGSIVGRARAVSPLLKEPLAGDVYFVKNVRKDPETGNEIRTLPMIVVALRGEIAINLKGESDTTKAGKLVSTFNQVPDAPVSRFNLNINGGNNGILAVTRTRRSLINLCAKPRGHVAESDMDGHNGRRHDTDIRMTTPCSKRQVNKAKRAAKRANNSRRNT